MPIMLLLLLSGGDGSMARAQEAGLSLGECLSLALKHNQDLERARITQQVAGFTREKANASNYPDVSLEGSSGYISQLSQIELKGMRVDIPNMETLSIPGRKMEMGTHAKEDLALSLTQPLYSGGRIKSRVRMADAGVDIAFHQVALEKQTISNQVTTLFFQLAKALEYRKVVIQSLEQMEAHLKDAKNLVGQGMLLKSDLYPIEIRRLDTKLMIIKADNAVSRAKAALAERLGLSPEKDLHIRVNWNHAPPWPLPTELSQEKGRRQETMIARKQIELAQAEIELAEAAFRPQIGLAASSHYGYPGFKVQSPEWDSWWQAGILVSFTLFDGEMRAAEREIARLNKRRSEKAKESVDHRVALDQINARLSYEEAQRNMEITRQKVLAAKENFRLKNDNFKAGMATNTDFLDAHTELVKARAEEVFVSAEIRIAWSDLLRALGKEEGLDSQKKGEKGNE